MTGLAKQTVLIALGQGVDTKSDSKVVPAGKLLKLLNGVFKKKNRIDKRNGYSLISGETISGESLADGAALQTFNDELLQYNKQKLYSFSSGSMKWIDKGDVVSATVESKQIVKNTAIQTQADFATNNGISVYAYEDSRGGIRATVYDESTGTPLVADTLISATGSRARCVAFGFYLFIFYYDSGSLYVRRINPLFPTSVDAPVTVSSTVNTADPNYDVVALGNIRMFFAHNVQGANEILIGFLDQTPAVLTGILGTQTITEAATDCLGIVLGPNRTFYVFYANATNGLQCTIRNSGGNEIVAPFNVDPYTSTAIRNVTGFSARNLSGVTVFYEISDADTFNHYVKKTTVSTAGSVGSLTVLLRSVGLWSKAFSYYFETESIDHGYVCVVHDSTLQKTLFITRDDGLIVAKLQYSLASGLTNTPHLGAITALDDNTFAFAILNAFKLVSEGGDVFSVTGVSQARIDFDATEQFNALQMGDNLHITGGVFQMYDGQSVVEHGFHLYPENLSSTDAAGSIPAGIYNYVAVYEWTDNYGLIHRSAPSVPHTHTIVGPNHDVTVTIPTLRLTRKVDPRTDVSIVLYRTEEGPGSVYYRVSPVGTPIYNDTSVDSVTIVDTLLDSAIISQEILYTTGGVLENIAPPSCKYIEQFKDRIFLGGLENPNEIWFSKMRFAGQAVEFNADLKLDVASEGGGVTGLATLDDKEVIFKRDRFFITFGDGPNNTGTLGEFAKPQFVSADVGCNNNNSIVRMPNGIMFGTEKGIYALNGSLNVSYVGAEVEEFNDQLITSATLTSETNQVRFTTQSGPALVYDYFFQQWSTFDPYSAKDSLIWDKSFVFMDANGTVFEEDDSFRDNGKGISMSFTTGWIAMDSIVGFQRVYKLLLIGQYKSRHKLKVSVGYDFSESFEGYYVMDTQDSLDISTFGEESPFGNETPFGGDYNTYRFSIRLDRQKCQAVRFKIEDLTASSTTGSGEAYNITGLGLLVGVKGTPGKFKDALKIASS